jgi:hypothetical protein
MTCSDFGKRFLQQALQKEAGSLATGEDYDHKEKRQLSKAAACAAKGKRPEEARDSRSTERATCGSHPPRVSDTLIARMRSRAGLRSRRIRARPGGRKRAASGLRIRGR